MGGRGLGCMTIARWPRSPSATAPASLFSKLQTVQNARQVAIRAVATHFSLCEAFHPVTFLVLLGHRITFCPSCSTTRRPLTSTQWAAAGESGVDPSTGRQNAYPTRCTVRMMGRSPDRSFRTRPPARARAPSCQRTLRHGTPAGRRASRRRRRSRVQPLGPSWVAGYAVSRVGRRQEGVRGSRRSQVERIDRRQSAKIWRPRPRQG